MTSHDESEQLRKLLAVTDSTLARLDVEDLLFELLDRVRSVLDADTAAVLLRDGGSDELVARAARGLEEEVRQGVRVPIGIGFAVPVDIAKRIIPEILSKGYVSRPWLGVSTLPLDKRIARAFNLPVEEGIIVGDVYRNSGAASAGLRPATVRESIYGISLQQLGDVILTVGGRKVASTDDLQNALQDKKPGETVDVELLRQGRRVTVPVRLSERPVEER